MGKVGRPKGLTYSDEVRAELLANLEDGMTLRQACELEGMPTPSLVLQWAKADTPPGFATQYAEARLIGYQHLADEIKEIADNPQKDFGRDRLRVDTRKWLLSKALPKIYGDKMALTGPDGGPLEVDLVDARAELARRIAGVAARVGAPEDHQGDGSADGGGGSP